jgi:hypothetical protein
MPQPVSPSAADWVNGTLCNCCGPTGKNGPIGAETFIFTGPTIPGGTGILPRFANTGWMVEGGIRSLFFNTRQDAAWALIMGLTYQYNNGSGNVPPFAILVPPVHVRVREIHRFSWSVGVGRDWFLYGQAQDLGSGTNFRMGFDTGGRWGGERVNLNVTEPNPPFANLPPNDDFLHNYKTYGGYYIAAHADLEVPMSSWVWFVGFRTEWGINFSNVVPPQSGNMQDINLLMTTGIRF